MLLQADGQGGGHVYEGAAGDQKVRESNGGSAEEGRRRLVRAHGKGRAGADTLHRALVQLPHHERAALWIGLQALGYVHIGGGQLPLVCGLRGPLPARQLLREAADDGFPGNDHASPEAANIRLDLQRARNGPLGGILVAHGVPRHETLRGSKANNKGGWRRSSKSKRKSV